MWLAPTWGQALVELRIGGGQTAHDERLVICPHEPRRGQVRAHRAAVTEPLAQMAAAFLRHMRSMRKQQQQQKHKTAQTNEGAHTHKNHVKFLLETSRCRRQHRDATDKDRPWASGYLAAILIWWRDVASWPTSITKDPGTLLHLGPASHPKRAKGSSALAMRSSIHASRRGLPVIFPAHCRGGTSHVESKVESRKARVGF